MDGALESALSTIHVNEWSLRSPELRGFQIHDLTSIEQLISVLKWDKLSATEAQMKAIETLQNTRNNWSDGNWSKESKENIKNKEPVTIDRQSPRVLKARGPRMQQAPRAKRTLKSLQSRMNQPVRLDQPILSPQNKTKNQSECTSWTTSCL